MSETPLQNRPLLCLLVVVADKAAGERLCACLSGRGVRARHAVGAAAALKSLRCEESSAVVATHTAGGVDALAFLRALRSAGDDTPVVILGERATADAEAAVFAAGGDGYRRADQSSPACLLGAVERAIDHRALIAENRRLHAAERRRLTHERDEADRLLAEQRALIGELEGLPDVATGVAPAEAPADSGSLETRYADLLRAYVVMGAGSLADEIGRVAERLVAERRSAPQVMELHLTAVAQMVDGLGPRGGRHVMARADLLVLEMMAHLAEAYRRRYVADDVGQDRLAPWVKRFAA